MRPGILSGFIPQINAKIHDFLCDIIPSKPGLIPVYEIQSEFLHSFYERMIVFKSGLLINGKYLELIDIGIPDFSQNPEVVIRSLIKDIFGLLHEKFRKKDGELYLQQELRKIQTD